MPFLIFLYPFLEIFLIVKFSMIFSFWDVLLFMVSTGALGFLIMSLFGKALLMEAQRNFSEGRIPDSRLLHRILMFIGGFFIFLPGVFSDFIGVFLLLPGFRHLTVVVARFYLSKAIAKGSFRFVKMGSQGFSFGGGFASSRPFQKAREERDAQIIDVEVIESSKNKEE